MASNDILESQNQLRLSNIGCDVIFEIGAKLFPAHRVVLMARLEYFRNMFTTDMKEKKELTVQFDSQIIDSTIFGYLLDYIYTLKIDLTNENIRPIYRAADYFCFDELTTMVREYMETSLKIENAVLYRDMSVEFHLKPFEERCEKFIIDNSTSEIIKNQLITTLSLEELKSFVEKLKKNNKHIEIFNFSVDWYLRNKPNQVETLFELFENIPVKPFMYQCITDYANSLLLELDTLTVSEPSDSLNTSEVEPQLESLYAIGGKDGQCLSSVSIFNNTTNQWILGEPMLFSRAAFGCAVIGHKIYVCGGSDGRRTMNELSVFDARTQIWPQLTPMKHARQSCATAVLNGQIYVAGGMVCNAQLSVVERYDADLNQWYDVAPMPTKRSGLELVALNGFLYAIGGIDDKTVRLNIVERYDPQTDQWTRMNNTNYQYSYFGSAVRNGKIYIVRNTCEVYDPADDRWTEMPDPTRCDFGRRLAVYNDKLYAIGGVVGNWQELKGLKTVEVYDFEARVWRQEPDMNVARCFHQLAVVKR